MKKQRFFTWKFIRHISIGLAALACFITVFVISAESYKVKSTDLDQLWVYMKVDQQYRSGVIQTHDSVLNDVPYQIVDKYDWAELVLGGDSIIYSYFEKDSLGTPRPGYCVRKDGNGYEFEKIIID